MLTGLEFARLTVTETARPTALSSGTQAALGRSARPTQRQKLQTQMTQRASRWTAKILLRVVVSPLRVVVSPLRVVVSPLRVVSPLPLRVVSPLRVVVSLQ